MRERNIALIGFRATGKSSVGKILARKLSRVFIDMDLHLSASAGREIACWVRSEGWGTFRKAESELLTNLASRKGLVVSTGGGIVLAPENLAILDQHFFTVWLKASAETIHARINSDPQSCSTRPPLSDLPLKDEIEKTLLERTPLYSKAAGLELDTEGKTLTRIVQEIADYLQQTTSVSAG
ncbi:MAG: shikimate kinase [Syntrophobacteraceae bacterium]